MSRIEQTADTMTGQQFARKYGVTIKATGGTLETGDDGWEHYAWTVTLSYSPYGDDERRKFTTPYRMGTAHVDGSGQPRPPGPEVIESLALDARCGELTFGDFCADLGYDTDSRKDHAAWQACRKTRNDLSNWCRGQTMLDELLNVQDA